MDGSICLTSPCAEGALTTLDLVRFATAVQFAVLFLQSGVDKVVDRKGNLAYLVEHFAKSPLASMVVPMVAVITVVELAAGITSALGAVMLLVDGSRTLAAIGALLAVVAILMLFFGQRMAKDYAGAAALVPYFIAASVGLGLMGIP